MGKIKKILLDVPNVDAPPDCLDLAVELAQSESALLSLMTVLPSFKDLFSFLETDEMRTELQQELEEQAESALKGLAKELKEAGLYCRTEVSNGSKVRKLIAQIIKDDYDLLIKDVQTQSDDSELGYTAIDQKFVRQCPCPIWFVNKEHATSRSGQIVLAIDAEIEDPFHKELNRRLVQYSLALVRMLQSELHIIHVWSFDLNPWLKSKMDPEKYAKIYEQTKIEAVDKVESFRDKLLPDDCDATFHLLEGNPGKEIANYCRKQEISTLIMGSVGRAGISGFLIGNTAERVMKEIECSLLVVSPEQIQSSIELNVLTEFSQMEATLV